MVAYWIYHNASYTPQISNYGLYSDDGKGLESTFTTYQADYFIHLEYILYRDYWVSFFAHRYLLPTSSAFNAA